MTGWRDISTADRGDGSMPLLHLLFEPHDEGGFCFVGAYDHIQCEWFNNIDFARQNPTHWWPLPSTKEQGE